MVQDGGMHVLSSAQSDMVCLQLADSSQLSVAYSGIPSLADCASTWAPGKGWKCRACLIGNRKGKNQE